MYKKIIAISDSQTLLAYAKKLLDKEDRALLKKLFAIAQEKIVNKDPAHDIDHAVRVLVNAIHIRGHEGKGDMQALIPAALFHDVINYPKSHKSAKYSAKRSAKLTRKILRSLPDFPKDKITLAGRAISEHSNVNKYKPSSLESAIIQDADSLDDIGMIALIRTFSYTGVLGRKLYFWGDPFCQNRKPNGIDYGWDRILERSLTICDTMHTKLGKKWAKERREFISTCIKQLQIELFYSGLNTKPLS